MCRFDAVTRTVTDELRDRQSQVVLSRRHMFANATHANRNTSWLGASWHRSNKWQQFCQQVYSHAYNKTWLHSADCQGIAHCWQELHLAHTEQVVCQ